MSGNSDTLLPVNCQLPFVSDESCILSFDDLVKICSSFYSDDFFYARTAMESSNHRLLKRKGVDKWRATVEDIVKIVVDPSRTLPVFYGTDLARIPPTVFRYYSLRCVGYTASNAATTSRST